MSAVGSRTDLIAWQKSIDRVARIEELTRTFPPDECLGLTPRLRRAAVSVAGNIAARKGRGTTNELIRFLGIASGSKTELETHVVIAQRLGYITSKTLSEVVGQIEEAGRITTGLRKSLEQ